MHSQRQGKVYVTLQILTQHGRQVMHTRTHTHIPLSIWLPFPGVQQLQDGVYLQVAAVLESNVNPNPTGADRGEVMVVGDRMREVILDQVVGRGGMRRTRLEERDGPSLIEQHNTRTASSLGLAFPRPRPAFRHSKYAKVRLNWVKSA